MAMEFIKSFAAVAAVTVVGLVVSRVPDYLEKRTRAIEEARGIAVARSRALALLEDSEPVPPPPSFEVVDIIGLLQDTPFANAVRTTPWDRLLRDWVIFARHTNDRHNESSPAIRAVQLQVAIDRVRAREPNPELRRYFSPEYAANAQDTPWYNGIVSAAVYGNRMARQFNREQDARGARGERHRRMLTVREVAIVTLDAYGGRAGVDEAVKQWEVRNLLATIDCPSRGRNLLAFIGDYPEPDDYEDPSQYRHYTQIPIVWAAGTRAGEDEKKGSK